MSSNENNNLLRQGSILAVAGILVRVIGILYRIPMSNMLGDAGNGIYSVAFGIYNVTLTLASSSLPLAVSKLIAQRTILHEHKNAYKLFKTAMVVSLSVGLAAALFLFFGADFLEVLYAREGLAKPLRIVAPTVLVMSALGVLRGYFQGKGTMVPTALSQLLEQIVNAVISIVAIAGMMKLFSDAKDQSAYGAAGGIMGTLAGAVSALLFLLLVFGLTKSHLRRQLRRDRFGGTESVPAILKALAVTVIPVILSQTVYQIGFTLDDLMFGNLMEMKGYDSYTVSSLQGVFNSQYNILINAPVAIATAIASSAIPSISASTASGDMRGIRKKVRVIVKFNMVIAIPSAVGLAVLAKPILTLLFPSLTQYRDLSASLLMWGSSAVVFYALSTITSAVLQSLNRMRQPVIHGAVSMALHVIQLYLLLKFTDLDIYAMIIANVTFPLIICILNWHAVGKALHYRQEIPKTFLVPLLSSAIMGVAAFGGYQLMFWITHSNLISLMLAVLLAVATYGFCLLWFRCFTITELGDLPMGGLLIKLATRLHLLP